MGKTTSSINISEFLDTYNIKGKRVAVALSGGPDSVCLIHKFCEIKDKYNINLSAAHLNHKIRDNEADRDMQFCIDLCKELNVPLCLKEVDVKNNTQKGESLELAARRIRYAFFEELDCDFIATAHNCDDNAETIILNLIRGSGNKGIGGIPVIRGKYIRPLLNYKKQEILDYLSANNYNYVTDSTNKENDYSRNKIRNLVFPVLKTINENFLDNINRFSLLAKQDEEFLNKIEQEYFEKNFYNNTLDLSNIKEEPCILSRVIKLFFNKNNLNFCKKTADELIEAIKSNTDAKINISKNLFIVLKNNKLSLINCGKKHKYTVKTEIVNNLLLNNTIDCDKLIGQLVVSVKQEGDTLKLKGRPTKELRRLYSEKQIQSFLRETLPVARDDMGVVWAYKIGTAERVLPNKNSKNILRFKVEEDVNG